MKKLIITIISLIGLLSITSKDVFAAEYKYHGYVYEGDKIDNIYFKNKDDTLKEAHIYKINNSDKIIYSIEYENDVNGASRDDYDDTFNYSDSNITKEQAKEINLIGYYGYNYKSEIYDHTDIKWYAITQYLIWQVETNNALSGIVNENGESIFASEIEEMNKIIANHYILPDFGAQSFKVKAFDEITLEDTNGVLKDYNAKEYFGLNYEVQDNKVIATSNQNKTHTIYFTKSDTRFSRLSTFYISDTYRNAIEIGKYEDISTSVKISFVSGKVTINKMGEQLIGYKDNKFIYDYREAKGVTYQLFAKDDIYNNVGKLLYHKDELVSELVIGEQQSFDNLYLSEYYALETYNPYAYHMTGNPYKVNLSLECIGQSVTFKSPYQPVVIKFGTMKQTVNFTDGISYGITPLANAKFGLFADMDIYSDIDSTTPIVKKDTLIDTQISDAGGSISFKTNIPVGKYYILRLDDEDKKYHAREEKFTFTFNVDHSVDRQYFYLNNYYAQLNIQNITFEGIGNLKILDEDKNIIIEKNIEDSSSINLPFGNYYYQFEDNNDTLLEVDDTLNKVIVLEKEEIKIPEVSAEEKEEIPNPKEDETELDESLLDKPTTPITDDKKEENASDDIKQDKHEEDSSNTNETEEPKEEEDNFIKNPPIIVLPSTSNRPNYEDKNEDVSMNVITPPANSSDDSNQEENLPKDEEINDPEVSGEDKDDLNNSTPDDEEIDEPKEDEGIPSDESTLNKLPIEDTSSDAENTKEDLNTETEEIKDDNYPNDKEESSDNSSNDANSKEDGEQITPIIPSEKDEEDNTHQPIIEDNNPDETINIPIDNNINNSEDANDSTNKEDTSINDNDLSDIIDGNYEEINVKVPATDKNDYSLIIYMFILLISSFHLIHEKE